MGEQREWRGPTWEKQEPNSNRAANSKEVAVSNTLPYSISRFSFREKKTGKALLSRMAKIKPNEKKTGNQMFKKNTMASYMYAEAN